MSHITEVTQVQITDAEAFVLACQELGFNRIVRNATVRAHDGRTIQVEVGVQAGNYGVGLVRDKDGKLHLMGDFQCFGWHLSKEMQAELGVNAKKSYATDKEIADCLTRFTTKHAIIRKAKQKGYSAKVTKVNGKVQIELSHG